MSRTILITGATSGIGEACAKRFAANDDNIIITGRRKERLFHLKTALEEEYGCEVCVCHFDVRDKTQVKEALDALPEKFKSIQILVNNAGLAAGKDPFESADVDDWEQMIQTNVLGLLFVTRQVLPALIQNRGHIINIGSTAGDAAYPGGTVYCATKAAVDMLSAGLRIELLQHKMKVTNIKPGAVETEFSMVRFKGDQEKAAETYKGYQPLNPEDVADTIFYCAGLPEHVCINELTLTCTAQANSFFIDRND